MKTKNYYVYGYIRLDTNTYFYIGKGKDDRYLKISQRSSHFENIINKVNCAVEIIYNNLTEKEAFKLECETIEELVFNEGYSIEFDKYKNDDMHLINNTWGGEGATGRIYVPSQETLLKLSISHIGNSPGNKNIPLNKWMNDESNKKRIEKIKENSKSNPNYGMKNKHHSLNTKNKISISRKGKKSSLNSDQLKKRAMKIKETRIKNNSYGQSQKTKNKISESLKGRYIGNKNPNSKKIRCIETNIIYGSSADVCRELNVLPSNFCRAIKNNRKVKGFTFEYIETFTNND